MIAGRSRPLPTPFARRRRLVAAEAFGRSLRYEQAHARHVQRLAESLFDQLAPPLGLDPADRDLLSAAALLHDVGYVVSFRQHHKHTYHLVAHAQIEGFTPREHEVIAQVARYHRRSTPRKRHAPFAALPRPDRKRVRTLSALLRVADALDRRHTQRVRAVRCEAGPRRLRLNLEGEGDLAVEIHGASGKAEALREVFGREVVFRAARGRRARRAAAPPVRMRAGG
jgi:exopolyphosphatase/guanosine-5'-triphosphate,3'-diphosphate pyrophosphatase